MNNILATIVTISLLTIIPYLIGLLFNKTSNYDIKPTSIKEHLVKHWFFGVLLEIFISVIIGTIYVVYDLVSLAINTIF